MTGTQLWDGRSYSYGTPTSYGTSTKGRPQLWDTHRTGTTPRDTQLWDTHRTGTAVMGTAVMGHPPDGTTSYGTSYGTPTKGRYGTATSP